MAKACLSQKSSLIIMIILTTSFFLAEIIVGYATNSMALVADSFHMLSDVVSLFVGFFALKISQQSHRHNLEKNTFGWVRAEVLGALVNSVFLVALCFSIFVESMKRIVAPEGIKNAILVLSVGAAGLVINLLGLCMFQGHLGHGHSHSGHGHSHAKNADNELRIMEKSTSNGWKDTDTVNIVIQNATVSDNGDLNSSSFGASVENNVDEDDHIGEFAKSHVHLTPSRYKMGIMLAAIQAEETENRNTQTVQQVTETIVVESDISQHKVVASDQMNIKGVYLHVLGDALGSVIVIASALAIHFGSGKWTLYIDPAMSILMVAIILKSSVPLLKESSMILLQTVPTHIQIQELEEKLLGKFPSIISVHEFHIWQLAGSKIVASLHLKLPSRGDYMGISESMKKFFHEEGIHSTTIQPEFIEEIGSLDKGNLCLLNCPSVACEESVCCKPKVDIELKRGENSTSTGPNVDITIQDSNETNVSQEATS